MKLIGIVGPSGSGKTTLVKQLASLSEDVQHIRLDNYFKDPETFPRKEGFLNWERPENLKFDELIAHLKLLKEGKEVHTKTFPKKKGSESKPITLKPKPIVIIEGFMLFKNEEIREILDMKIYLDIPKELMLERRGIRFGEEHVNNYDTKVAIPEFLDYGIIQKEYADYVVGASKSQEEVVKEVSGIIRI
jgi:uridine kinase|tara:strand:- start:116 stop:685 length:570 start_codon:yes stop_codon:yes gene_type:complete